MSSLNMVMTERGEGRDGHFLVTGGQICYIVPIATKSGRATAPSWRIRRDFPYCLYSFMQFGSKNWGGNNVALPHWNKIRRGNC